MNLLSKRNVLLVLVITALLFAGLACNLPMLGRSKPTPTPIPVTGASVEELATQVASAAAGVSGVRVSLRDGQIKITGTASQDGFDLPLTVALQVSVSPQGLPQSEVVEARAGPLSVPRSMIDQFTTGFDQLLNERFSQEAGDISIDSITIADGKMTIVAHKR
jgi:hypothetical protein